MNRKRLAYSFVCIGIALVVLGVVTAPIKNYKEITNKYECDRLTRDIRETDKYCYGTVIVPGSKKDYRNSFVLSGAAVIILGVLYIFTISYTKKK